MNNKHYDLKESRNGDLVPVIDGIHLHSIYDPQKEALGFVDLNSETINSNNNFIIFGLGFGYHVQALINHLTDLNYNEYSIVVIEPNVNLVNDFNHRKGFFDERVSICSPISVNELFENIDFINFLKLKPSLLRHALSFEIYNSFYQDLLTYRAPSTFSSYRHLLNKSIQDMDFSHKDESLEQRLKIIKTQTGATSNEDFALLALDSLR